MIPEDRRIELEEAAAELLEMDPVQEAAIDSLMESEVLAEAARYEADAELRAELLLEADTSKDKPDVNTGPGERSDGLKVKCPKCGHRGVPKSGKCAECGKDVSKLAAFAKRLKGKTQEAEERGGTDVQRAIRAGLESALS